jgi:hypothetical protein
MRFVAQHVVDMMYTGEIGLLVSQHECKQGRPLISLAGEVPWARLYTQFDTPFPKDAVRLLVIPLDSSPAVSPARVAPHVAAPGLAWPGL